MYVCIYIKGRKGVTLALLKIVSIWIVISTADLRSSRLATKESWSFKHRVTMTGFLMTIKISFKIALGKRLCQSRFEVSTSQTLKKEALRRPPMCKHASQNSHQEDSWPVNQRCTAMHASAKSVGYWRKWKHNQAKLRLLRLLKHFLEVESLRPQMQNQAKLNLNQLRTTIC